MGRGVARSPAGPFADRWRAPLVCRSGEDTWLYAQRLSPDGTSLTGRRVRLVKEDRGWEASVVEAPTMWREAGRLYLFFSGNAFDSDLYAVGYATCVGPLGPCRDAPENPILHSACRASGPGHQAIVLDGAGDTWLAYHAYPAEGGGRRLLWIDRLRWKTGKPVVSGPTCRPQPARTRRTSAGTPPSRSRGRLVTGSDTVTVV